MAASEENLLSLGHLNGRNENTFSIYRNMTGNIHKTSQMVHLRQRWQQLKDRERAARHQNQELLKQFDRAQDTLREMMAATAAMKTIRLEYEPFLVESSPNRHKQQRDKTSVPKSQKMDECMNREEEFVSASSVGKSLFSHGHARKPQIDAATKAYNGLGGSYPPYTDSLSFQSHSDQTITAPVLPPTLRPCPQNFQLQHLIATPSRQCRARQNLPGWATNQADGRHSSVVSYPEDAVTSGSSRRKNVHLFQELDFKPVRLSNERGETRGSSSSSTGNRQVKSEKKRRKTNTSLERDRSNSLESKTSSPVMAQISESEASSHKGSTSSRKRRNNTGLSGLPMKTRNETQECESPKSCSKNSEFQSEREVSQSPLHQSESSSRCNSSSRSEELSGESDKAVEGVNNKGLEEDVKADCKIDGKEESDMEDSEDEDTSPEDERENESDEDQGCNISDELNKNSEEEDSAQDEEEDGSEDNKEEDRSDEEEQMSEERAEEKDSDDIIISPQQNKTRVHFILQEHSEDDNSKEGCRTETSDEDSSESGDDDIENLLAPQPQTKIEEKVGKEVKEPKSTTTKVICNMEIFRGETHTDRQSDSDEFDHFYD